MKKALRRGMILAFIMVSMLGINTSKAQGSVSLQVFYDELQPYGNWMDYGNYGYVWRPNVGSDFTPYATNGYWINTEYGNTWISDYAWGWAPFHYGRWFYDDFQGWMWIPDTEWAPAWVAWRSGGGYYGWAPLMPGLGINVSFNYYNNIPHNYWNFVPYRYITYRTVYHHCVARPQVINIINNTTIVTHNHHNGRRGDFFTGPSRTEIERTNHERVQVYTVNDRNRPGRSEIDRGSVSFYKPRIENTQDGRTHSAPSQVVRGDRSRNENGNRNQQLDLQTKNETRNRAFDNANQDQQLSNHQQRSQQTQQQSENRQAQQNVQDFNRNSRQRTYVKPQQSFERQQTNRQSFQQERTVTKPNSQQRTSVQPQREQQLRKSSFDQRSSQPSRSTGQSKGGSSHRRH
ncbi:MAG: DUF6600 domain-containing protein [Chryseolinea sp.]